MFRVVGLEVTQLIGSNNYVIYDNSGKWRQHQETVNTFDTKRT